MSTDDDEASGWFLFSQSQIFKNTQWKLTKCRHTRVLNNLSICTACWETLTQRPQKGGSLLDLYMSTCSQLPPLSSRRVKPLGPD
ncbi:hypothetical protein TRIATDRAFT_297345 [Trichoderma atroviride IMI 206040]|uniref:Uncharacterized protein n=1 Tax=Hypocrea atroviridis (strain ATCC 20476 / IMI 206040) TaxID=452589 RepID=G9NH87_HYPAI|nr:uncharacterized protein TRIATDRAFT_297345 [Trichoderma atroviride IMI 206040]EHK49981.1 hypothetical protein TRIATDRAFT_297345 [Trichoderma atroviride IMI 206040]